MTIEQLTFLRFIAASAVVVFHFGRNTRSLAWANALWDHSNVAVSFFFVLSGFILAHVYGAKGIRRALDFYVARIARIVPIYWLALLLVVLYEPRQGPLITWWVWLSAGLLQSWWIGYSQILNVPGWSLSVEVFFYLLFPLLLHWLARLRTRTLLSTAATAWSLNLALHVIIYRWTDPYQFPYLRDFTFYSPFTHLATFVVGIAGGIVFDRWRASLRRWAMPLMVASTALFLVAVLLPNPAIKYMHNGLLAPVFLVFLWGLGANPDLVVARVLRLPPLVLLGEVSYGIYILQLPVRYICSALVLRFSLSVDASFAVYYLMLVAVSVWTYRQLERPSRESIKRLYNRFVRAPFPASGR
jgi:peptidoglycan/LPS O-acetylase OafA/YrhL